MRRSTSRTASVYSSTLHLILRAELLLEARQLLGDRIEDALVLPQPRFARRPVRAAAVAEQPLEHRARVVLHRQRLRRRCARRACACRRSSGCRCRRRRSPGRPSTARATPPASRLRELPREQLVHRHVGDDLDLVSSAARRAGQKRSGRAGVDVVPVRLDAGQHEHLVPERRQRLQDRRSSKAVPSPFGVQYSIAMPFGT